MTANITNLTRRNIIDALIMTGPLEGRLELIEFLSRVWDLSTMPSTDERFKDAAGDIWKHMVANDDWSASYLYNERLALSSCTDPLLFRFLEAVVHPMVRQGDDQAQYVAIINDHLHRDGFELRATGDLSGHPVYAVARIGAVARLPRQLIFASTGGKPDIVITDAISNDIKVVRGAEHCLVYDRPIGPEGLSWRQLVGWWADSVDMDAESIETERAFYERLAASLPENSPPAALLFRRYFEKFHGDKELELPAIIPEVYLHYDPFTLRQRGGVPVLNRQRMDFLFLLPGNVRVVIEVDGKHHYAHGDVASPARYAGMVRADRELRLSGYEVYRLGGHELAAKGWEATVDEFFGALFLRYGLYDSRT